jgi:hypothetical protein
VPTERFVCPDCGYGVQADEDGCCASCGRDCAIVRQTDEPCKCGKVTLRPQWSAITDAGNEGTDYLRHARDACLTRTERDKARHVALGSLECTCASIQAADVSRHFRECPMRAVYPMKTGA